ESAAAAATTYPYTPATIAAAARRWSTCARVTSGRGKVMAAGRCYRSLVIALPGRRRPRAGTALGHRPSREPVLLQDRGDRAVLRQGGDRLVHLGPDELAVRQRDASHPDPRFAYRRSLEDREGGELGPLAAHGPPRRLPHDQRPDYAAQQRVEGLLRTTDWRARPTVGGGTAVVQGDEADVAHRALHGTDPDVTRDVLQAAPAGVGRDDHEAALVVGPRQRQPLRVGVGVELEPEVHRAVVYQVDVETLELLLHPHLALDHVDARLDQ